MKNKNSHSIPILMYHSVGRPVLSKTDAFLNVSADAFRKQMRVLDRLGFRARRFDEVVEALRNGYSLPRRTCAITFDDAYRCVLEHAAPILAERAFTATLFAVSSWCEQPERTDLHTGGLGLPAMNWEELRNLLASGWEAGGHTRTHCRLDALDEEAAFQEIVGGKEECEARLSTKLKTFCYPYGSLNSKTAGLLLRAGLRGACTTRSGLAGPKSDPFLLPRVKIGYRDGVYGLLYRMFVRPSLPNLRPNRHMNNI